MDSPVSGGVGGAQKGTLAVMVSGPKERFDQLAAAARDHRQGLLPGREARAGPDDEARQQPAVAPPRSAITSGGDGHGASKPASIPAVMLDVINAGSGRNTASQDKFPKAILPRTFDFGFTNGAHVQRRQAVPRGSVSPGRADVGRERGAPDVVSRRARRSGRTRTSPTIVQCIEKWAGVEVKASS